MEAKEKDLCQLSLALESTRVNNLSSGPELNQCPRHERGRNVRHEVPLPAKAAKRRSQPPNCVSSISDPLILLHITRRIWLLCFYKGTGDTCFLLNARGNRGVILSHKTRNSRHVFIKLQSHGDRAWILFHRGSREFGKIFRHNLFDSNSKFLNSRSRVNGRKGGADTQPLEPDAINSFRLNLTSNYSLSQSCINSQIIPPRYDRVNN